MTTENVAVLFTDIVGSTELSQRLSPPAADEVRRGHFAILRQAVTQAGGTEVKSLGDGMMVVFSSASAALDCAVAVQQGVDRDNRANGRSVGLRVGVSGGEVGREEGDYFGDPVVEAARLCARCESGQVLATEWVRLTAGRRNRHECRPGPTLALEGLPDPVETVDVLWKPEGGGATSVPLPGRLAVRPAVGVVGRTDELSTVDDAAKRVAGGGGRAVLLISGEAGMGKTTLAAVAAQSALDAGYCVLFGHCEEDFATPYQLFAEALGHYVTHAAEDQLLTHVGSHGSELARLVPALADRIPDLPPSTSADSDTERFLLFAAVVGLLAAASEHQPTVLVLDDLQWADKGSLLLLRHLAAAEQAMRLLIIGTYRDSELSHAHPLTETLAALHRQSDVSRIDLTGLDDRGVVSYVEAAAGQALDDTGVGLAHALYRETDGNPFFVGEVLRHLSETGAIYQDAGGRWVAKDSLEQMALPASVRTVIGARVGRLGDEAGRVLSVASVIGRDFDLDLLARATGTGQDDLLDLLDILDAAAAAALVRELPTSGRYSFAHSLIQHTLYVDLSATRRARMHRQVALALEDLCGDRPGARAGELARHWYGATRPVELGKAIGYSRQAGDEALRALAPADALQYYVQALDLYPHGSDPDPVLELDLTIGLGTAQRQTGDPAYRDTLLGAARRADELGDTRRLVAASLANDRGMVSSAGVVDEDKVAMLEVALTHLPEATVDRALVLAQLCQELLYGSPLERRRALAEEAIALALASPDDAAAVRVLNHVSNPLRVPQVLEQSLAWSADALRRAERIGDPVLLFWAANKRHTVAACAADFDEMDRCLDIVGSQAERLDQPMLNWVHTYERATRAIIAGDTEQAERLANAAVGIGSESGQPDAAVVFGTQVLFVHHQRGTIDGLIPLIEQTVSDNPGIPAFGAALAMAQAEGDHFDEAERLLEQFAASRFELPLNMQWITGMCGYAAAAVECRNRAYAQPIFERLVPWADRFSYFDAAASGPVSQYLGGLATVLGRYDEADAYFARSAAVCDGIAATFFAAGTNLLWGRMLAERRAPGDVARARDLLGRAQAVARERGYATVDRRAAAALHDVD